MLPDGFGFNSDELPDVRLGFNGDDERGLLPDKRFGFNKDDDDDDDDELPNVGSGFKGVDDECREDIVGSRETDESGLLPCNRPCEWCNKKYTQTLLEASTIVPGI